MKKKNTKRSDGRYSVQVYLGEIDGKRKYKTVYGATQKEADKKAEEVKLSMRKGIDVTSDQDTFQTWAERWERLKATEVSAGRMDACRGALKQLAPLFPMPLCKIQAFDVQSILTACAQKHPVTHKPAAKKTLLTIRSVAKQIFDLAIENRVTEFNPATNAKIPSNSPSKTRRALTDEEQRWIVETPHRARRAAMIMMYAGLRRGELIPLTWSDINLTERTIRVDKSVEMIKGKSREKDGAKTYYSVRTIDIPQRLADFLRQEKEHDLSAGGIIELNALVCTTAAGKMHSSTSWKRMWESYLKELNFRYGTFAEPPKSKMQPGGVPMVIPQITAHWLRHTFATMLYLAGVDILTAKEQLGHADIKTTLEIYTHLDSIYKRKSMNKLDSYLSEKSANVG